MSPRATALLLAASLAAGCDANGRGHPPSAHLQQGGSRGLAPHEGGAGGSSGSDGEGGEAGDVSASELACYDRADEDRDGLVDCADPDCSASCESPCSHAVELTEPVFVRGSTLSRADAVTLSCGSSGAPDVVFAIVAASSGVLDVSVGGSASRVAVRTSCQAEAELACTHASLSVPVVAGDRVLLVVEADDGGFTLDARSRTPRCGDGVRDDGEQCDDGNESEGDGCDSSCALLSSERAGNDAPETADPYPDGDLYFGGVEPAGDADYVAVTVTAPATRLVAYTFDFGDAACERGLLDSSLELFGAGLEQPLAADDDGGAGGCSRLISPPLEPGVYTLRITASAAGATPTFPYVLLVDESVCGDGLATTGESCDDGATAAGDGCGPTCLLE